MGATDFHASVAFNQKLGMRLIVSARDEYARFELPDGDATFSTHVRAVVPSDGPVIYFEVEDVDGTVGRLEAEEIAFSSEPQDQPWLWREARLADPSGNQLCFFHAGVNRRYPPWRIDLAASGY